MLSIVETESSAAPQGTAPSTAPFKMLDPVYVRESDGLMYKAVIRKALYGFKFQKHQAQLAMGEDIDDEEDDEVEDADNAIAMWHYFVHFPGWKVIHDRWVSAPDIFVVDLPTKDYADRLAKEHRELYKRMSSNGNRRLKRHQRVNGIKFLSEWSKRMHQITAEVPEGALKQALERWQLARNGSLIKAKDEKDAEDEQVETQETTGEQKENTSIAAATKKRRNMSLLPLSTEFINEEIKLRRIGLTSKLRSKLSITLPIGLKKILVEQWELICQCDMLPVLPSKYTIRQALDDYVASKGSSTCDTDTGALDNAKSGQKSPSDAMEAPPDEDEWRVMAKGIAQMFNESLPVRLLYSKELTQFERMVRDTNEAFAEVYGCEHLLRLFVKLPEILSDNLPHAQCRPIVAKVNDLLRYLHKNHTSVFQQQNKKQVLTDGPSPAKKQRIVVGDAADLSKEAHA